MSDPGGLSILRTVGGLLATKRFTWQPVAQVWLRSTIPKVSLLCRFLVIFCSADVFECLHGFPVVGIRRPMVGVSLKHCSPLSNLKRSF